MHDPDARELAETILRARGVDAESLSAKRNIDRRLDGLGQPPSSGAPTGLRPGREVVVRQQGYHGGAAFAAGAAGGVLIDPEGAQPDPYVVPSFDVEDLYSEAIFEPSDLIAAQAVTGLATTAAGGTEVRFNTKGVVHVGGGAIGVYWNRPLGANVNFRWAPLAPGLLLPYNPKQGLFVGTNNVGGIKVAGVLTLAFYQLPPMKTPEDRQRERIEAGRARAGDEPGSPWTGPGGGISRPDAPFGGIAPREWTPSLFRAELGKRLVASGSDMPAGAIISAAGGGTDVTLGTFSDAGAGTQIFLAGSNMPAAGASALGATILNARPANTDVCWVAETSALAVASNGGLGPSGQDSWNIPNGGTLFMLAASGTQVIGARYRS